MFLPVNLARVVGLPCPLQQRLRALQALFRIAQNLADLPVVKDVRADLEHVVSRQMRVHRVVASAALDNGGGACRFVTEVKGEARSALHANHPSAVDVVSTVVAVDAAACPDYRE